METQNPLYHYGGPMPQTSVTAAVVDITPDVPLTSKIAQIDIVAEFEDAFKQADMAQQEEESPLMEQANVLMNRAVFDVDKRGEVETTLDSIKIGKKIAGSAARIMQDRHPTNMEDAELGCFACRSNSVPLSFEPLSDAEYAICFERFPTLATQLAEQENGSMLHLKRFLFNNNEVMRFLSEFIWRHPNITGFTLEHDLGIFGERPLLLAHALANHPQVKVINFNYTDATVEFTASLGLVARFAPNLESVTLANAEIRNTGALFWGLALTKGAPKLRYLDLSAGKIQSQGATALAIGLRHHRNLRILNLSDNRISRHGCMRLGEALVENPLLEELDLSRNAIGSRGACAIAAFLTHPNARLITLIMAENDIGQKGGKALSIGLSMNQSLKRFILTKNDMGDDGCAGFGHALEKNSSLEFLDLTDNDITDMGAAAIALGLKSNKSLQTLFLANEVIRDAGAEALATCLAENESLVTIHLEMNAISDQGAAALADMLKKNTVLQELKLNDNEIGNRGAVALAKTLSEKQNRHLQTLDLTNNPISEEVSKKWFSAAESRVVTTSTQRIDIVAAGTAIARGNLREFGVVVIRTRTSGFLSVIMIFVTLFVSWFDFISDLIVVSNEIHKVQAGAPGASIVYVVLTVTFVALPFFYILIMFSLPADETDTTLPAEALQGAWGSSSIRDHMEKVSRARCSSERFVLTMMNIFQARLAYEIYLSWKNGLTTLAYSSIRLVEVVFEALPQSIVQLHIILSSATLSKIAGGVSSLSATKDTSALVLLISIGLSIFTLSRTISDLFEKRYVVNWKRNAFHHEDLAMALGMVLAFLYHLFHFSMRALTIALASTIYSGIVCAVAFVVGVFVRVGLSHNSERRKSFAIVSYFVGSASWDRRFECRLAHLIEFVEMLAVIIPLWIPIDLASNAAQRWPLAFQDEWIPLILIATPAVLTGIIACCWLLSNLLYYGFIERIHLYTDVSTKQIDLADAERLARSPFDQNARAIRERRREKLEKGGGENARYGQLFAGYMSAKSSKDLLTSMKRPKSKWLPRLFRHHMDDNQTLKHADQLDARVASDGDGALVGVTDVSDSHV